MHFAFRDDKQWKLQQVFCLSVFILCFTVLTKYNENSDQFAVVCFYSHTNKDVKIHPAQFQIQDARNHVNQALQLLSSRDESYYFKTGAEVNKVLKKL